MTDLTAPTGVSDRIGELDIIRGFALFGVLWMNVEGMGGFVVPREAVHGLTQFKVLEDVVGFLSVQMMGGKAQALFSMLFGFGFAIMMDRIGARGGNGTAVYLRRLAVLLAISVAHASLLWMGDILNAYALMGFLLLLTRRWSDGWLLTVGVILTGLLPSGIMAWYQITGDGGPPGFVAMMEAGAARLEPLVLNGDDYFAFVATSFRGAFLEFFTEPLALSYFGWILGRFMIGSWIYRQGWLQAPERHLKGFAVVAATLIPVGLLLQMTRPIMRSLELEPMTWAQPLFRGLNPAVAVILAIGYAALIVILCQWPTMRRRLSSLGSVGQMALTNYLTQSLFFVFVLYGFGLGLLPWMGPTLALVFSVGVFALQVLFSRWWLARHRFGPAEWLWRWATYGVRPPLQR